MTPASCTPSANPQTAPSASTSIRSKQPVAVNGIEGEAIIAYRCELGLDDFTAGNAGTTGYGLVRNAILITKTTL